MLRLVLDFSVLNLQGTAAKVLHRSCSYSATLLEKLGLPEKPKKPASTFVKFRNKYIKDIQKKYPDASFMEITKIAAQLWKDVPVGEKEDLKNQYKMEFSQYKKELDQYEKSLTEEQKHEIQQACEDMKAIKNQRLLKKLKRQKLIELNKPIPPFPPFIKFLSDLKKANFSMGPSMNKQMSLEWSQLSEKEKDKYKKEYSKSFNQYKEQLNAWEEEMIKKGHLDFVRLSTLKKKVKD